MAKIIGYYTPVYKKYKKICPWCGAIVIFDENELHHTFRQNEYAYSDGICPGCSKLITVYTDKDEYIESK